MDAHWIVLCLFTNSIRLFTISIANIGRGLHALAMILQAINFSNLFSLVSFLSYIVSSEVFYWFCQYSSIIFNWKFIWQPVRRTPSQRATLFSWFAPLAIEIAVLPVFIKQYGQQDICFLTPADSSIWAFAGPALIILSVNLGLLCTVCYTGTLSNVI